MGIEKDKARGQASKTQTPNVGDPCPFCGEGELELINEDLLSCDNCSYDYHFGEEVKVRNGGAAHVLTDDS